MRRDVILSCFQSAVLPPPRVRHEVRSPGRSGHASASHRGMKRCFHRRIYHENDLK